MWLRCAHWKNVGSKDWPFWPLHSLDSCSSLNAPARLSIETVSMLMMIGFDGSEGSGIHCFFCIFAIGDSLPGHMIPDNGDASLLGLIETRQDPITALVENPHQTWQDASSPRSLTTTTPICHFVRHLHARLALHKVVEGTGQPMPSCSWWPGSGPLM